MKPLTKGRYRARLATSRADGDAVLALRSKRFRGRQSCSDRDAYDALCDQGIVENTESGQVICAFRLLSIDEPSNIVGSYSGQFYDLTRLSRFGAGAVELGRFCCAPSGLDPDVLRLAWAAITRYVDDRSAGLLFGCSSFVGADPAAHRGALGFLGQNHRAPDAWRPIPKASEAVALPAVPSPAAKGQGVLAQIPPLLRTYLAMGGWVSDHAVQDRDLDTLHVFTGVEIAAIPPRRAEALRALAR
ncbi:MAG: GNAT family N-acyltransferase [Pseudomonadota bacterium]